MRAPAFSLLSSCLFLMACGPDSQAGSAGSASPESPSMGSSGVAEVAYRLEERDLFPEGIAYDPLGETFYLGSLLKSKIISVSLDGEVGTLVPERGAGVGGILGLQVDADRRILWANYHQSPGQIGFDSAAAPLTGIHKFNLDDGSLLKSYSVVKTEDNHLLNDIALAQDGSVYLTSFSKGTIYRIDAGDDELVEWLDWPEGVSTNGIDITPDGRFLFVVGNDEIYRVEISTREMITLAQPEGEFVGYGDGLYVHGDGLVMIASWMEDEVLHYHVIQMGLSDDLSTITSIEVLDRDHPLYAFPTTGAFVGDWFFYIATAQFDKRDEEGNVAPWEEMSDIILMKVGTD